MVRLAIEDGKVCQQMTQCRECNKEFISHNPRQEFCNDYCRGAYHRRRYRQQAVEEAEERRQARIDGRGTAEQRKEADKAMAEILERLGPRIHRRI
jgi:hypothetical protein